MSSVNRVVSLKRNQRHMLGCLRGVDGVSVFAAGDVDWVRAPVSNEAAVAVLKTLPGDHFQLDEANRLIPVGNYLATKRLCETPPSVPWIPIDEWISVDLPASQWPAEAGHRVPLKLVASESIVEASAVLTTVDQLASFVCNVPQLRFRNLSFAMNRQRDVFVRGKILPSVPGRRFWVTNNIAVPAGRCWTPSVGANCLVEVFGADAGTVVWYESDRWEVIAAESFAPVTRAALRASASFI